MTVPVLYARPGVVGRVLDVAPALASWDGPGSPGQIRFAAFVAEVGSAIAERLPVTPDPLALRLDIGLPNSVPLLAHNDLDNYLFALVPKLTAATGDDVERLDYAFSGTHCLPVTRAEGAVEEAGTLLRPDTVRRYAERAGFDRVEVVSIAQDLWRFYRLGAR
jgi:hypothetical protein